jgi:hypothetical protein
VLKKAAFSVFIQPHPPFQIYFEQLCAGTFAVIGDIQQKVLEVCRLVQCPSEQNAPRLDYKIIQ